MYGFPKQIQTRHDVEYLVGYLGSDWATPANIERGLDMLRSIRDRTQHYVFDRVLGADESPDGAAPDYIVLTDEDDGNTTRRQLKLVDNPNAMIHRLGYTIDEIDGLIQQIQGVQ